VQLDPSIRLWRPQDDSLRESDCFVPRIPGDTGIFDKSGVLAMTDYFSRLYYYKKTHKHKI
jgi:hypothetical protein